MFIITQRTWGVAPTAAYCKQITTQFKITWPVLRDPTGTTLQQRWGLPANRDADYIIDATHTLELKLEGGGAGRGGGEATIAPVIDALLKS